MALDPNLWYTTFQQANTPGRPYAAAQPAGVFVTPNNPQTPSVVPSEGAGAIPRANPYLRSLASSMMATGASTAPVGSPLEGLARALTGVAGGYFAGQANEADQVRQEALGQRIGELTGLTSEQTEGLTPEMALQVAQVRSQQAAAAGRQPVETWNPMPREQKIAQGLDPERPYLVSSRGNVKDPTRSGVNVDIINERKQTAAEKLTEADVERMGRKYEEFDKLSQLNTELQLFEEQLPQFETGAFAEGRLALGRMAAALGAEVEGLGAAELMKSIQSRLAPAMRVTGSGSSSDRDVQMFLNSLPNLSNTVEGNRMIINNFRKLYRRKQQEMAFTRAWIEETGSLAGVGSEEYAEALDNAVEPAFSEEDRATLAGFEETEEPQRPDINEFTDSQGTKWRWSPSQNLYLEVMPGED